MRCHRSLRRVALIALANCPRVSPTTPSDPTANLRREHSCETSNQHGKNATHQLDVRNTLCSNRFALMAAYIIIISDGG